MNLELNLIVLGLIMLIASIWDFKTKEIPNWLNLCGILIGLSLSLYLYGLSGLTSSLISLALIFVILGFLWGVTTVTQFKILGAGDIKLFMVLSTFVPFDKTFQIIWYSIIVGGVFLLFLIRPKRIFEMFKDFVSFILYFIPGKSPESMQKRSFAPIIFATLILDYLEFFDFVFR